MLVQRDLVAVICEVLLSPVAVVLLSSVALVLLGRSLEVSSLVVLPAEVAHLVVALSRLSLSRRSEILELSVVVPWNVFPFAVVAFSTLATALQPRVGVVGPSV